MNTAPFPFSDEVYRAIYPGWGRTEAEGDWREQGGKKWNDYVNSQVNLPNYPSADDYIKQIAAMLPKPPAKYMEKNPFAFDEQAAKEAATAEFSPYYQEALSDYMADVNEQKRRVGEDKVQLLKELEAQKDYFNEKEKTNFDRLIRGIKEGYSSRGLYFSGVRHRTEAEAQSDYESGLQDYMRQYKYKTAGIGQEANRSISDINKEELRKQRDIGREQQAAIEGQTQKMKGEALNQYLYGMEKYYKVPNWGSLL